MAILPGLSSAAREIAQWRLFFRARGSGPPRRPRGAGDFDSTPWPDTEWAETRPDPLAASESIDPRAEAPR